MGHKRTKPPANELHSGVNVMKNGALRAAISSFPVKGLTAKGSAELAQLAEQKKSAPGCQRPGASVSAGFNDALAAARLAVRANT